MVMEGNGKGGGGKLECMEVEGRERASCERVRLVCGEE